MFSACKTTFWCWQPSHLSFLHCSSSLPALFSFSPFSMELDVITSKILGGNGVYNVILMRIQKSQYAFRKEWGKKLYKMRWSVHPTKIQNSKLEDTFPLFSKTNPPLDHLITHETENVVNTLNLASKKKSAHFSPPRYPQARRISHLNFDPLWWWTEWTSSALRQRPLMNSHFWWICSQLALRSSRWKGGLTFPSDHQRRWKVILRWLVYHYVLASRSHVSSLACKIPPHLNLHI